MACAATHYHRIETADMGLNTRPDMAYLITRLQGQLQRLHALTRPGDPYHPEEVRAAILRANQFAIQLANAIKDKHYDVI